ncbi:Detected protein of confused Function [Hibiscus syriacus]|uniref:Detected protein of confused Function n=1 Tax=Hibiscus syriacus TaxID=106335 RepID=A0A6A3CHU0_HIBSY|nr:Detected protein of confused Function [Hibiscus syriacus]
MNPLKRPLSHPFFGFNNFRSLQSSISNEAFTSQIPIFNSKFSGSTMPVSTAHSSSFSRFNTHFSNSLKQPILTSKAATFPQIRTFCVEKPNPNADLSASNDIPVVPTVSGPIHSSQPIDAGYSMRKPISLWPGMYHSPVTNALWEARSSMFERRSNETQDSQTELVAKTPSMSRTSIAYKFSSDYILREQYSNPWDEMRMGKLLEDLDVLAGTISYKTGVFSA